MKNYRTMYTNNRENAWEYFFTQPNEVTEEEAYAGNYIVAVEYRVPGTNVVNLMST